MSPNTRGLRTDFPEPGPESLVVADFDVDGRTDFATANDGTGNVVVLLGRGDGRFEPAPTFVVGEHQESVITASPETVKTRFEVASEELLDGEL